MSGLKGPSVFNLEGDRQSLHLSFPPSREGRKEKKKGHGGWAPRQESLRASRGGKMLWVPRAMPHIRFSAAAVAHSVQVTWQRPPSGTQASLLIFPPQSFSGGPGPLLSPPVGSAQRCEGINARWGTAQPREAWGLVGNCPRLPPFE